MKAMGAPYKGVLFAGIMLTDKGPKLVEYNARFGDPECQVLMLRMMSDIVPALLACADGQLKNFSLRWYDETAITVIMATKGYPGDYSKGSRIEGLDEAAKIEGVEIFHAGTKLQDGHITAYGGRVLNVCALGKSVSEARDRAYAAIAQDRLARRLLPHRHRLARGRAGAEIRARKASEPPFATLSRPDHFPAVIADNSATSASSFGRSRIPFTYCVMPPKWMMNTFIIARRRCAEVCSAS